MTAHREELFDLGAPCRTLESGRASGGNQIEGLRTRVPITSKEKTTGKKEGTRRGCSLRKGGSPCAISISMIPKLQISTCRNGFSTTIHSSSHLFIIVLPTNKFWCHPVWLRRNTRVKNRNSVWKLQTVPTIECRMPTSSVSCTQNPKSANLTCNRPT